MLQTKWLVFFMMAFILGSMISGVLEMSYLGENGGTAVLSPFFETWGESSSNVFGKAWDLATNFDSYEALWNMFTWNYAMYTGAYAIARIPLLCISAGMALTFIITMVGIIRGSGT
jgi:hypothetical protein